MATGNKWAYSKTPSNNGNILIDNGVDARESQMTVPQVNDTLRSMMAVERAKLDLDGATITSGGSAGAYTFTSPTGFPFQAYATGQKFSFVANHTNAGAATLNVDGLGAKNIFYWNGNAYVATIGNEIISGKISEVQYDGTQFRLLSFNERLLNVAPIFGDLILQGLTPSLMFEDTDAPSDEKKWFVDNNAGNLNISSFTDAGVFANIAIGIDRTGTTIDKISLNGTGVDIPGGLNVGFVGTLVADRVNVGDANFGLAWNATSPSVVFDTGNDSLAFNRSTNLFTFSIASTPVVDINASGDIIQDGFVYQHVSNSQSGMSGGNGINSGANILLNGQSHATAAYDFTIRTDTTAWFAYDHSASTLTIVGKSTLMGSPTGGAKGAGTLNAVAVYDDNVLLTDLVLDVAVNGYFDTQKYANHPIAGEISKSWFDPDKYAKYWRKHRSLPGMKSWENESERPSTGELATRLTAVVETQAVLIEKLNKRLKKLEKLLVS